MIEPKELALPLYFITGTVFFVMFPKFMISIFLIYLILAINHNDWNPNNWSD